MGTLSLHQLYENEVRYHTLLGSFSKPRRRRQRERHQTKGLMSRAIAVHVRVESLLFLCCPLQNSNVK